jgi:hypothetical protein
MASQTPYAQLTGTWKFWLAAASTAEPDLDDATLTGYTLLGATDGDQNLAWTGALTMFGDNNSNGPRKHVRAEEGFNVGATVVELTLENLAYVLGLAQAAVASETSGVLDTKKLPLKRGYIPNRYALLARGGAVVAANTMSAYGAWPGQLWIPQGVFDGEPSMAFGKSNRPGVQFTFKAEVDSSQAAGYEFGQLRMQSA